MPTKKLLSVALILMVFVAFTPSVFAGGQDDSPGSTVENVKKITFPLEEQVTINMFRIDFGREWGSAPMDEEWEKRTNIKLVIETANWGDYGTKLGVLAAAGDLPDRFMSEGPLRDQFGPQGLLVDFAPYLDGGAMPNLADFAKKIPAIVDNFRTGDGNLWCAAPSGTRAMIPRTYMYRKDLFDKYGLPEPTSIESAYTSLQKLHSVTEDAVGILTRWHPFWLIGKWAKLYRSVFTTGYPESSVYLNNETLKYQYGPIEENFKKAITMMAKFYQAGLIDQEFASPTDDRLHSSVINGKTFYLMEEYNTERFSGPAWQIEGEKRNPDFNLVTTLPPKTEGTWGQITEVQYPVSGDRGTSIAANSEHVDVLVALINWDYAPEQIEFYSWGVEGVTFSKDASGKKAILPSIDFFKEQQKWGLDGIPAFFNMIGDRDLYPDHLVNPIDAADANLYLANLDKFNFWEPKTYLSWTQQETDEITAVTGPATTFQKESVLNFIMGRADIDKEWDNYVDTLKKMGVEKIVKMYQDKYDALPGNKKGLNKDLGL